jgi:hypothetical protein
MPILMHSCSPVEDGILHNTPALHHSSTPFKNHTTAEPSLSAPRKAGSSTGPSLIPLSCAGEDQVFKSE